MATQDSRGLYRKFDVTKRETGEGYTQAFVLAPETDAAARAALAIYAAEARRGGLAQLADDLDAALARVERGEHFYAE